MGSARAQVVRSFWRLVGTLVVAVVLAVLIRTVVVGIYAIPTRSMEPTLLAGDVVLVNKVRYWIGMPPVVPLTDLVLSDPPRLLLHKPQRGDVVVFRFAYHTQYPSEPEYFVKRIVGVPGDTLYVVGDSVYTQLPRGVKASSGCPYCGRVIVPAAGMVIELSMRSLRYWRPFIEREGNRVDVVNRLVLINGESRSSYTFRNDFYYVMGDNRSQSFDSRHWGFVSQADIVGSPCLVLWSRSPALGSLRWNRFGVWVR